MTGPNDIPVLRDGHRRRISYLRLSITDRCNLRCQYCMPADGEPFLPHGDLLTDAEILTVGRVAVGLGIRKIRVTGGEPLMHPRAVELLGDLRALPGLERLVLTTNGMHLVDLARPLRDAGVEGVNISIDSLRADRYAEITRGGAIVQCHAGIDAALAAGFHVKLNMVVMRGVNDDEIADYVELARARPLAVRFIEYMPMRKNEASDLTIPSEDLLDRLRAENDIEPIPREPGQLQAGPARNFHLPGAAGTVGVISPMTHLFCASCNRIRVGADGLARGCLFLAEPVDLRPLLREGRDADLAAALLEIIQRKPERHFHGPGGGPDDDDPRAMSRLGG